MNLGFIGGDFLKVTMSSNIINQLLCDLENFTLKVKNKRWNKGRHRCRCHICGQILDSRKDNWCPEECGWMRLKGKIYDPWICHQCLEHHDSLWIKKNK